VISKAHGLVVRNRCLASTDYLAPLMIMFYVFCETVDRFPFIKFEFFAAVTMKNGVFWDVTPCGSCENRRFGGT
jgi:hypothetical protein